MRLGLDLLFMVPGETGGRETYSRELLRALRETQPDLHVTAFLNRETAAAGPGWWSELPDRAVALPRVWARKQASWALGETVVLTRAASAARVQLLHSPANFGPAAGRFARVLTLHDLMYRLQPELVSKAVRVATDAVLVPAAKRAHRVITATEASREEIAAELGLDRDRIVVIPHGAHPPPRGTRDLAAARARLEAGTRPIVLAVATNVEHKNHPALLAALAELAPEERPLLVIAGHGTDELAARAAELGVGGDARLLGAVSDAELEDLYAVATVYVTATRHEGFGLPVIEAMGRGLPVAASDIPVLREVAGDAGWWFAPEDPRSIATTLRSVLAGGAEVEDRRRRGLAAGRNYTWATTAALTVEAYAAALSAQTS
ncbi:glycosyltransferase family 4 protein [Solirubrobacter phytolaccae]|uniref:Glycosyltransferase family 4 protein n=1 Tax=Solirubrobacter phytolaccae TaxID=1404360 RepID=A0A9X3NHG7_9ACTN|nr:glycosyltransferase family 1 protein [Solirubrobacter phytolaccae]MDA0185152.1 glycosyltransferase family 4 protein [Solirubrobacter phytolaccae]